MCIQQEPRRAPHCRGVHENGVRASCGIVRLPRRATIHSPIDFPTPACCRLTAAYPLFEDRFMPSSPADFPLHVVEEEGRVTVRFPENTALSDVNAEELAQELGSLAARRDRPH